MSIAWVPWWCTPNARLWLLATRVLEDWDNTRCFIGLELLTTDMDKVFAHGHTVMRKSHVHFCLDFHNWPALSILTVYECCCTVFLCSLPSLCVFLGPCHYAMHHDASSATGAKHASFPIFSVFLVDYRKINPINPSRNAGKYKVSKWAIWAISQSAFEMKRYGKWAVHM